jgi:hypothetical protein
MSANGVDDFVITPNKLAARTFLTTIFVFTVVGIAIVRDDEAFLTTWAFPTGVVTLLAVIVFGLLVPTYKSRRIRNRKLEP